MRGLRWSIVTLLLAAACGGQTASASVAATPSSSMIYGGLGSWIDIFDGHARANPERVVASLHAHGVTTLYLQTSNYSQSVDVVDPSIVGRFVDAAHAAGIHTVAWYLPSFAHPRIDARRARAALRFRSTTGERFDSVALDIEASVVKNVRLRTARLLALSRALRVSAGPGYPLGAIVPSPVGMRTHPKYWPRFPFREVDTSFDALLPMAYFTYHAKTPAAAYAYTHDVMTIIREQTGDPDVTIHLIGGIANHISRPSLGAFIRAAQECGVAGLSLYAYPETSGTQWARIGAASLGGLPDASCD
jgi:hypothetical protein